MNKFSSILILLFVFTFGLFVQANNTCTEVQFGRQRLSPNALEHYGYDYNSPTGYVAQIEGHWYLITWEYVEAPCSEDDMESNPAIPMNECLGLNPLDYGMPATGVFTIDNIEYPYADNLSFIVPMDAIWTWELYHEGNLVLIFAQDFDKPCYIAGGD